jgi:hypothetical protein
MRSMLRSPRHPVGHTPRARTSVTRPVRLVGLSLAAAMVLAACSGGGDAAPAPSPAPSAPAPAPAAPPAEPFFQRARIEVIIPFGEGGAGDFWGRTFANALPNYLAGSPRVGAVNQPGAGGLNATQSFFQTPNPDSSSILFTSFSIYIPWILGAEGVNFDLSQMQPLLGIPANNVLSVRGDTGITSAADLLTTSGELVFGGRAPDNGADLLGYLSLGVLGLTDRIKVVYGYEDLGGLDLAFEQGEINVLQRATSSFVALYEERVRSGDVVPLYSYGLIGPDGNLIRDPGLPDVPHLGEAYQLIYGRAPSGEAWDAFLALRRITGPLGFAFWAHQDAPEQAVTELRAAIIAMIGDPAFLTDEVNARLAGYEFEYGDAMLLAAEALSSLSDANRNWIKTFMLDTYGVTL